MDFFDIVIKRVANFSIQSYQANKNDCFNFFNENSLFQLSILTSSKSLYDDLKKNKLEKVEPSLLNYFSRAHFNPTPFGLFSSVGLIKWDGRTKIKKSKKIELAVRYDNLTLAANQKLKTADDLYKLLYSVNPSIYDLGNGKIALYNSKSTDNDKIELSYVELEHDDQLKWLLEAFKKRTPISLIAEDLVLEGFEKTEIDEYLNEILDTGLIIENVNFDPYSAKLLDLNNLIHFDQGDSITLVKKGWHIFNDRKDIQNFSKRYFKEHTALSNVYKSLNTHSINSFEKEIGAIDVDIKNVLKRYVDFTIAYNSHTSPITGSVNKFIAKISERYNDGFIPFNDVFNPYSGVKYTALKSDHQLKFDDAVLNKIIASDTTDIKLNLNTTEDVDRKKSNLPATFSILLEVLECRETGKEIIYIKNLLCGSALNLISRFGEVSDEICNEIISYEKSLNSGKLIADINCIGNLRSINLAPKKQLFDYSIAINTSSKDSRDPILTSDLLFHLSDGSLRLVSKEYRREILPKKVSSINSKLSDSETYNFLCDFEMYNEEIYGINFDFNAYEYLKPYVSRIYMEENVLLFPAQLLLIDRKHNRDEFKLFLKENILAYNFSQKVSFTDRKGSIVIDTDCDFDVDILYNQLKKRSHFYVSECIYDSFIPKIFNEKEEFVHELVVSVKNDFYKNEIIDYGKILNNYANVENTALLSDWLYFDVFCNSYADSEILRTINDTLLVNDMCDKFFFVHYDTPDRHLRLRFQTSSLDFKMQILEVIGLLKNQKYINDYCIRGYKPEVFRYGGSDLMNIAEIIFDLDSRDFIQNVLPIESDIEELFARAAFKIINYLKFLGLSLEEMIRFCDTSIENYKTEFKFTLELRKGFNTTYDVVKLIFETIEFTDFLAIESLKIELQSKLKTENIDVHYYGWLLIHMSMNRHFSDQQRLNEFKSYYYASKYLNKTKYSSNKIFLNLEY